ncbi:TonB-dependent receptor [Povalibacter sp.]|uniref:TonB-dependent receptor n=1 Tax=Povalibacter sp. TaxID=1962978 RepID=UPI002F41F2A2
MKSQCSKVGTRSIRTDGLAWSRVMMGALLASQVVNVQSAETEPDTNTLMEVVVTGSRIRGIAPVGSNVVAVGRDEIDMAAVVNTTQLIQEVPQVFNLGISETSRGQSGGNSNITLGSAINLRGLGPFATLTLVDGHRAVPQGTSGFAVDPSSIPMLALERVEIVADGASAIYGSDAIAGVANLVLRRNFDGLEVRGRYGFANDADENQIGLIYGHTWESGQITIAAEHQFRSALNGEDRDYFRADLRDEGGRDYSSRLCQPGNIVVGSGAGATSYAIPAGGVTPGNAAALLPGTFNLCDPNKSQDLLPQQERNGFSLTFDQEITGSWSVHANAFGTKREFENDVAYQTATLSVPTTNAFFVAPPGATLGACPASAGVPAGTLCETVQYSFRNDSPLRRNTGFSEAAQVSAGTTVKLPAEWQLDIDYTYGHNEDEAFNPLIAQPRLAAAVRSNNAQTALNPFGGPNDPAVIADIFSGVQLAQGTTNMHVMEAAVGGKLFELPGGAVRVALGYEGQRYNYATGVNSVFRHFERDVDSGYLEVLLPIVGSGNAVTGIRALMLNVAGRYDKYSDVGDTTNPKYGLDWKPIDSLTFRASYGESFRAPGIAQIYGNTNRLFVQNYADPTLGGALRIGATLSGGNLDLKPETSETTTFGIEFEPDALPGFKANLTYFDIDYDGQVTQFLSDLTILNREAEFAGTGIIVRNPDPAFIANLATLGVNGVLPPVVTLFVDGRSFNLGSSTMQGFDAQFSYLWDTNSAGQFRATLNGSYLTTYEYAITPSAPMRDSLDLIYNPLRLKVRGGLSWNLGGLSANATVNYIGDYINNLSPVVRDVDSFTSLELYLGYSFADRFSDTWLEDLTVALDVTNAFDEEPPFVDIAQSGNGGGGFDPTLVNPLGRVIGFSVSARF